MLLESDIKLRSTKQHKYIIISYASTTNIHSKHSGDKSIYQILNESISFSVVVVDTPPLHHCVGVDEDDDLRITSLTVKNYLLLVRSYPISNIDVHRMSPPPPLHVTRPCIRPYTLFIHAYPSCKLIDTTRAYASLSAKWRSCRCLLKPHHMRQTKSGRATY